MHTAEAIDSNNLHPRDVRQIVKINKKENTWLAHIKYINSCQMFYPFGAGDAAHWR